MGVGIKLGDLVAVASQIAISSVASADLSPGFQT